MLCSPFRVPIARLAAAQAAARETTDRQKLAIGPDSFSAKLDGSGGLRRNVEYVAVGCSAVDRGLMPEGIEK